MTHPHFYILEKPPSTSHHCLQSHSLGTSSCWVRASWVSYRNGMICSICLFVTELFHFALCHLHPWCQAWQNFILSRAHSLLHCVGKSPCLCVFITDRLFCFSATESKSYWNGPGSTVPLRHEALNSFWFITKGGLLDQMAALASSFLSL